MQGLVKIFDAGTYTVHTPEGIQLSIKKRSDKNSYYVYYKRKQIYLSDIPELSTQTYPIYWNYIFEGGWERGANVWCDKLLAQ